MEWSDFVAVVENRLAYGDLRSRFGREDLAGLTAAMFADLDRALADAADDEIGFVPVDPTPDDPQAVGWTLGHVVAHLTAIFEESAAQAATLARGVAVTGPARAEVPWESLGTTASVRGRLRESRRMCLAYLAAWPDEANLDVTMVQVPRFGPMDAIGRHLLGIVHASVHLPQLREIRRQTRA